MQCSSPRAARLPVVSPMLMVSISLLMERIVSKTDKAGRSSAPGTLKYLCVWVGMHRVNGWNNQ